MQYNQIYRDQALIGGKGQCSNSILGDPLPGIRKQCWCEPWESFPPTHISVEGDTKVQEKCPTGKYVYFGRYKDDKQTVLDFEGMTKEGKYLRMKNQDDKTTCSNGSFKENPQPGIQKQCFCDLSDIIKDSEYNEHKSVWEQKEKKEEEEKNAREQAEKVKQAEAEAQRLREKAIEDAKNAEEEKKRKLEEGKSRWFR